MSSATSRALSGIEVYVVDHEVSGLAASCMGYLAEVKARRMKGFVDIPMDPTVVAASPSNFSNSVSLEV